MLSSGTWQTARVQQHVPFCCAAYSGEDACVASQPGQPGVEPTPARCGPAIEEVIAVEGAAGSGTASAKSARVGCVGPLPGRCADAAPGPAAPGLAGAPLLAAAAGGGIGAGLGLDDP